MSNGYGKMKIIATTAGSALAAKIVSHLSVEPCGVDLVHHNDGEVEPRILDNVRDHDVYVIAPLHPPAENFFEAVLLAEAARSSSARRVTMVIPYMGYARSDRKSRSRMPVGIKVAFRFLEVAKPDRMIILDIHAEQSLSIVEHSQVDHLFGSSVLEPELRKHFGTEIVIATPDVGGSQRASKYANWLTTEMVSVYKQRTKAGEVDMVHSRVIGEVEGKDVVFVDDIIDTGGTMIAGAQTVKDMGARSVSICVTHGLFSKLSLDRLQASEVIDRIFVTDSVNHDYAALTKKYDKLVVVSVCQLLATAIRRTNDGESLSELILQ